MAVQTAETSVWDPFVRLAHWIIAVAFFVAYLTEDDVLSVHVWAGYVVGALVLLRIAWGLVGPRYARFSDFIYAPHKIVTYLTDLLRLRAPRYLGHSPAGGAMVVALLLCLALTVATGLVVYAEEEGAGPLASLYSQAAVSSQPSAGAIESSEERQEGDEREGDGQESAFKDVHELLANITLALVVLHVVGVVLASLAHHENLARAMVTGRKRAH
ncbi:MAG: cytochrome b/b6 domain-containing protein [Dongiaceae bacterium]